MINETKRYSYNDLKEIELNQAPSLDLEGLQVDNLLMPKDGTRYMLFLTSVNNDGITNVICPFCKKKTNVVRNGLGEKRLVHDVIRNNHRVDIGILPQRYRCTECNQRFTPPISGIVEGRQMTERLYEYLKREVFLQPLSDLADNCGFSVSTIEKILDEESALYEQKRIEDIVSQRLFI